MAVLLTGEPGIGKSTLLLELADKFLKTGGEVLYIAGEESAGQIKIRANRLGIKAMGLTLLEETDVDVICEQIKTRTWKAIIVDSIQTMTTEDLTGSAGSVGQVRESANRILATTKNFGISVFLVGHVTKDGTIAGPKVIEHAVDTILTVEGEKFTSLRLIRSMKNRFGPTDEVGILEMSDTGLVPVTDFQGLFTDDKKSNQAGSCFTITMEGTRPILVEIQALVTTTPLPMPRRVASGVSLNRLQMILAVLQKRLSLPLYKEDVLGCILDILHQFLWDLREFYLL
jgi:DNA repair protein RadA/Sms